MKGKYKVRVQNRFVRYDFEIERNINIIRGDSATGKTTLINMIADYQNQREASGITLDCDVQCIAMVGQSLSWKLFLQSIHSCIVFIDEGEHYVRSREFAKLIQKSDNYFVIATRDNLYDLPYGVNAIYELKVSGKYGEFKTVYNHFKHVYPVNGMQKSLLFGSNKIIITEDYKSGYQFFEKVCKRFKSVCKTSKGKSSIKTLLDINAEEKTLVIADGAAFGPEMDNVYSLTARRNITLFLPESFEWLILKSGIIKDSEINDILSRPYDFIDSKYFFSWEKGFTALLIDKSRGMQYDYSKTEINKYYLSDKSIKKILSNFFDDI